MSTGEHEINSLVALWLPPVVGAGYWWSVVVRLVEIRSFEEYFFGLKCLGLIKITDGLKTPVPLYF